MVKILSEAACEIALEIAEECIEEIKKGEITLGIAKRKKRFYAARRDCRGIRSSPIGAAKQIMNNNRYAEFVSSAKVELGSKLRNATILIVDDEEMIVTSLESFFFLETDYDIIRFTSPLLALENIAETPVDLVIADYLMPEMNGIDFLLKFKEIYPEATRILLTGYADKENAIRAINELGLYQYVEKPWENDELLVTVKNGLERQELISELQFQVEKERRIRNLFQKYVPEELINEVLNPDHESNLMEDSDEWSEALNQLIEDLEEKQKIEQELQVAKEIQRHLLPESMPQIEGVDIAAMNVPSTQVGGDYYDFIQIDEKRWGIMIADVSGKGIPAGILMGTTRSAFRTQLALFPAHMTDMEIEYSVPLTIAKMNSFLYKDTESHKFVTIFYGILDVEKKSFTYTNAGHNPQLLYRPQDKTELLLTAGGIMVGVMEDVPFEKDTVVLNSGDALILYTDGVTDAINQEEEFFGEERFFLLVKEHCTLSAQELLDKIYSEIAAFSRGAPQFDDITLIVLKID